MNVKQLVSELTPLSHKQLIALAIKQTEQLQQHSDESRDDIAIIGMHCITPGASDVDGFWQNLMQRKAVLQDARKERFPQLGVTMNHDTHPLRAYSYTAGLIDGVDEFDPAFFGISPREARGMDPQQRLVLQASVEALANAGYEWESMRNTKTGVFVGVAANEYNRFYNVLNPEEEATHAASGNALNVIAGRVSYTLGLQGPAVAIDTACSSSLVALHLAVESLQAGDCDQALVGGVNVILNPATFMLLCQGQMLSPDGLCKTFDKDANGYVRAEAVASVVLKPLKKAVADGDRILAKIKGSAVNQDGRSAGLTVPSSTAQQSVIEAALKRAQLHPEQIDYVECHGTGTALGDPIEVQALASAYCMGDRSPLILGAAKSCIGHAESAAGLVGLIKAVVALQQGCIPPQANFQQWNPMIHVDPSKMQVPTEVMPWPQHEQSLRRCAVSSFGFSGTNAHIILEQSDEPENTATKAALPPVSFNKQRYWWTQPIDPILAAASGESVVSIGASQKPMAATENLKSVADAVYGCVMRITGLERSSLSGQATLSTGLGFDSLMISELRDQLNRRLQHSTQDRIPLQILFDDDRLQAIVDALETQQFTLRQAGDVLAADSEQSKPQTHQISDAAKAYFSHRESEFCANTPRRIERKLVHKSKDENVLVADLIQVNEKEFLGEMTQDQHHPYFYEHYLDHVPGLYVVEAVRQAATAMCHLFKGVDYSHAFILNTLSVSFSHFIEIDEPTYIHLSIVDETIRDGRIKLMEIDARVIHKGKEVARVTGGGDVSSSSEYSQYRGEALAAPKSAPTPRVIACFDLDGTLTHSHTFWRFLKQCAGTGRFALSVLRSLPVLPAVWRGRMTLMQAREVLIARCLRGVSEQRAKEVGVAIADQIASCLMREGALDAIQHHQKQGHETFIVSNSAEYYLNLLAQRLEMDGVFGSRFEVKNGVLTGHLEGTHCQGEEKVTRVKRVIGDRKATRIYAYGDSSGDIALLDWADFSFFKRF